MNFFRGRRASLPVFPPPRTHTRGGLFIYFLKNLLGRSDAAVHS
jgi:hypothetical protein